MALALDFLAANAVKAGSPQRQLWDECLNDTVAANAAKAGFRFAVTAIAAGIFRLTKSVGLRRRLRAVTTPPLKLGHRNKHRRS